MRDFRSVAALAVILGVLAGCGPRGAAPVAPARAAGGVTDPTVRPTPPLTLPVPPDQPKLAGGEDLSRAEPGELLAEARRAAAKGDYKLALLAQFWAVRKSDDGRYDLACYYARTGNPDGAFYWLQEAAEKEGVDADHIRGDEDLTSLRGDPRYRQLFDYYQACRAHAAATTPPVSLLYLPKDFDAAEPTPVVVLLHGHGSRPAHFLGDATQRYADELDLPVVSVSGTRPHGPKSFGWAVNVEQDFAHLAAAVQKHAAAAKFTPAPGKLVAVGFSEGAQVGLEVAMNHPEAYAGAVAISPGADDQFARFTPQPLLKSRLFVVVVGAAEHRGNVALARLDKATLDRAGVPSRLVVVPKGGHALPPDFDTAFPEWVRDILDAAE